MSQATPIHNLKGYLSWEQVESIIAVADKLRDKLLVRLPWRTGIRVSELINIRIGDIDFDNRVIVITVRRLRKKSGQMVERRRSVPVDRGTLEMVREYVEWRKKFPYQGDLLFPITRQRVGQIYRRLGRKVGIKEVGDPDISQHRKLHPHHLRRSFAVQCLKRGMSVERLQEILGHQSPSTTSVYLRYLVADQREHYDWVWTKDESTTTKD